MIRLSLESRVEQPQLLQETRCQLRIRFESSCDFTNRREGSVNGKEGTYLGRVVRADSMNRPVRLVSHRRKLEDKGKDEKVETYAETSNHSPADHTRDIRDSSLYSRTDDEDGSSAHNRDFSS